MKKKIIVLLVCTLMMAATSLGVADQTIDINEPKEPLFEEPAPVKKVKEIPVPWQFWEQDPNGVLDIIVLPIEVERSVALVRAYVVLDEELPLDDLMWEATMEMDLVAVDHPMEPYILQPGEEVEYLIPTLPQNKAVIMRYSVAWAETPDVIEAHFINEAILEGGREIIGSLSNFDVHNDYDGDITNFELELYGKIIPDDILHIYDPAGDPYLDPEKWVWDPILGENVKIGPVWMGGWGAPPDINEKTYGVEIVWIDQEHPVKYCEWIHFGVTVDPNAVITGARAHLTIFTSRDLPRNRAINNPFLNFLQSHPNMFPILRYILGL